MVRPPRRLLELVEYHAVLASGSHWMAVGVVWAMLAMRSGVLDSRTITEANGGGIVRDRRALSKMGLILAVSRSVGDLRGPAQADTDDGSNGALPWAQ